MSFHEKSAWACLISLFLIFVPYFIFVFQYPFAFIGLFVLAVIALILMLSGFHLLNALVTASIRKTGAVPPLDERDKTIELWAAKVSGIVLGVGVLIWCLNAMLGVPLSAVSDVVEEASLMGESIPELSISASQALLWIHALFAGFVFANLVYYFLIVFSYRRVNG